jgi:D-alanyl-D-alanine carboxypeptidase
MRAASELQLARLTPGFQYCAVDANSTLAELADGYAELAERRMRPATTHMAYSMSKTITAAAVLQLIGRGAIDIDEPLSRRLSWQPYGDAVTVRGLLAHTAGLPNPIPLRWVHPVADHESFAERAALHRVLSKHGKLRARPGTRFAYSNIGYWLLGVLIERVTGTSFASYVAEHILAPLKLTGEEMGYTIAGPTNHAVGYLERCSLLNVVKPLLIDRRLIGPARGRWVALHPHYADGPAFGGLIGTARAFGRFLQDQLRNESKILGSAARALFFEQQRIDRGPIPMTLGWHMRSLGAERCLFKEGGGGGFHTMMRLYPSRGLGSVFMANATLVNVTRALDRLDGDLLAKTPGAG